ncbi:hypothetical protein HPE56_15090 [Maribacter sp. ANRC-HE7]|uniref:Uncharacterized protein n=1 Tax=Maribacter aquimaris TaxID=2737171 RepID=A0ABR7V2T7_9FLAO|nr:hypothetical protein [Maribacter aquimaris]MBD0779123.1 hypothetical protein [Maribacter aquimaris]
MMGRKLLLLYFLVFIFSVTFLRAQDDCILGVGITPDSTLIEIFQLNEEQTEKIRNWSAELKYRNELLNSQADNLLKRHPQSTPAELGVLAEKYGVIRDSMAIVQRLVDLRALKVFNDKQYERYLSLCEKAFRQPYRVVPTNYRDSIPNK